MCRRNLSGAGLVMEADDLAAHHINDSHQPVEIRPGIAGRSPLISREQNAHQPAVFILKTWVDADRHVLDAYAVAHTAGHFQPARDQSCLKPRVLINNLRRDIKIRIIKPWLSSAQIINLRQTARAQVYQQAV